jgi:hypothetical protein
MDPHSFSKLDPEPDPNSPKKLDPDPHKFSADPKHCFALLLWIVAAESAKSAVDFLLTDFHIRSKAN